jgi:hypothetical protein
MPRILGEVHFHALLITCLGCNFSLSLEDCLTL